MIDGTVGNAGGGEGMALVAVAGGDGNALVLGVLTVCAGILSLVARGKGLDGTEGTDTCVESLCILLDSSSDGTFVDESAGADLAGAD